MTRIDPGPAWWAFEAGTEVVGIPSFKRPEMLIRGSSVSSRWRYSGATPVFRLRGYVRYWAYRFAAIVTPARKSDMSQKRGHDSVYEFVRRYGNAEVVFLGHDATSPKYVARVAAFEDTSPIFVKYGSEPAAQQDIVNEASILSYVPKCLTPEVLEVRVTDSVVALATTGIDGTQQNVAQLPTSIAEYYLSVLQNHGRKVTAGQHPLIVSLIECNPRITAAVEVLSDMVLTVAPDHGDFTPWNVFVGTEQGIKCIDWEFGRAEGCPELDLLTWPLQLSLHAYRESPRSAINRAKKTFARICPLKSEQVAVALVCIAASERARRERYEAVNAKDRKNGWRREVIEKSLACIRSGS